MRLWDTLTRLRAADTSDFGSTVKDWNSPPARQDFPAVVQPASYAAQGNEVSVNRQASNRRFRAWLRVDADWLPTDRAEYRGVVYEIDGYPQQHISERGTTDHLTLEMTRWEG